MKTKFPWLTSLFLYAICIVLISCNNEKEHNRATDVPVIKLTDLDRKQSDKMVSDFIDTFYCVRLDTAEYIGELSKVQCYSNKIFILDRNSDAVLIFSDNGKFLFKISKKGKGRGEYRQIADFSINEALNTLVILDLFNHKLINYDFEGRFISEALIKDHWANFFTYINKDLYVYNNHYNTKMRSKSERFKIFFTNPSGDILQKYKEFPKAQLHTNLLKYEAFFRSDSIINYVDFYDNYVYSVQPGMITQKYYLDFGDHNLPDNIIIKDVPKNPEKFDKYVFNMVGFYENEQAIMVSFFLHEKLTTCYYDKKTGRYVTGNGNITDNITFPAWNFYVMGCTNGYFISSVHAYFLSDYFKQLKEVLPPKDYSKLVLNNRNINSIIDITPNENPVLFFYKLKSF